MEKITGARRIPSEGVMVELASTIFETGTGLRIEVGSWRYRNLMEKGIAEVSFALFDGKQTVFNNVRVLAWYDESSICRIQVRASINGFSPMNREFYVLEECSVSPHEVAI